MGNCGPTVDAGEALQGTWVAQCGRREQATHTPGLAVSEDPLGLLPLASSRALALPPPPRASRGCQIRKQPPSSESLALGLGKGVPASETFLTPSRLESQPSGRDLGRGWEERQTPRGRRGEFRPNPAPEVSLFSPAGRPLLINGTKAEEGKGKTSEVRAGRRGALLGPGRTKRSGEERERRPERGTAWEESHARGSNQAFGVGSEPRPAASQGAGKLLRASERATAAGSPAFGP